MPHNTGQKEGRGSEKRLGGGGGEDRLPIGTVYDYKYTKVRRAASSASLTHCRFGCCHIQKPSISTASKER